jgi:serine/threonine protein kinase
VLCPRCGTQLADDANNCHNCGYEFAKSSTSAKETSSFFLRRRRKTQSFSNFPYKAGDTLAGRFDVKDVLGIGAFGGTLKVWDRQRQELLALKIYLADVVGQDGQTRLERVLDELTRLHHKNLVPIYEHGRIQDHQFALMQLLEGLTLSKIMKLRQNKGEAFNLEEIEPMMLQISDGLTYAQDFVNHGMLTPENILVLPEYLCITDIGLVTALDAEPRARLLARKPDQARYVAPEIRGGQKGDSRADVYSLGIILGEMATGQFLKKPVDTLFSLQPELNPLVDVIYRKATEPSPGDRYATPQALLEDVSAVLHAGELASLDDASTIIQTTRSHSMVKAVEQKQLEEMAAELADLTPPPLPVMAAVGSGDELLASDESLAPPSLPSMEMISGEGYRTPAVPASTAPVMPPPIPAQTPPATAPVSTAPVSTAPVQMPPATADESSSPYALQNAPTPYKTTSPYGVLPSGGYYQQGQGVAPPVAPTAPPTQPQPVPSVLPTEPPITSPYSAQQAVDSSHLDEYYQEPPDSALETEIDDDGRFSRLAIILGVAGVLLMLMALGIALYFKFVYFPQQAYLRKQKIARARALNGTHARQVNPVRRLPVVVADAGTRQVPPMVPDTRAATPPPRPDTPPVRRAPEPRRDKPVLTRRDTPQPRRKAPEPRRDKPVVRRDKPVVARRKTPPPVRRRKAPVRVAVRRRQPPPRRRRKRPPPPRVVRKAPPRRVAVAVRKAPTPAGSKCPRGMAYVRKGAFRMGSPMSDESRSFIELANVWRRTKAYCVDRYEYPGRGRYPKRGVSWYQAKTLCEKQGKRLCTEKEWERACKGGRNTRYPYGNKFNANTCNTQRKDGSSRSVTSSGRFRYCRSGYGVYDMSGNVAEWTSSRFRRKSWRIYRGGSSKRPDWAVRCATRSNSPPGRRKSTLGFRCCADPK